MEELVVEGLTPEDFIFLEKILKSYPITLESEINHGTLTNLHNKVKQITNYLNKE